MLFGIMGVVALKKQKETNAMRAAVLLAFEGVVGSFGGVMDLLSGSVKTAAISESIMAALCFIYIITGVKSLIDGH